MIIDTVARYRKARELPHSSKRWRTEPRCELEDWVDEFEEAEMVV